MELIIGRNEELPAETAMRMHGTQGLPHSLEEYVEQTTAQRVRREASRIVPGRLHISEVASVRGEMLDLIATRQSRRDGLTLPPSVQAQAREHRLEQRAVDGLKLLISIEKEDRTACEQWAQRAQTRTTVLTWLLRGTLISAGERRAWE